MDLQAKKLQLIEWLLGLQDEQMLRRIENLKSGKDWWDELRESDKKSIEEGLKDLEEGRVLTSDQVRKSIRKLIEHKSS